MREALQLLISVDRVNNYNLNMNLMRKLMGMKRITKRFLLRMAIVKNQRTGALAPFMGALLIGMFSLLPLQALAVKIGYVNAIELVETAPQGKQALRKLEDEFGEREQAVLKVRDRVLALEEDIQKNGLIMSDTDKTEKTKELRDLQRDLQRQQRELQEDYNLRRNEELARLQKIVTKAVLDIAKEESYDLIVQQAVWYSPETDMTEKVLERLSEMFK